MTEDPWKDPVLLYDLKYGEEHALQTLDVTLPHTSGSTTANSLSNTGEKFWIVFIHGGAWCDPLQDKSEPRLAFRMLTAPDQPYRNMIAGFASINYGLSPRPGDPSDAPERNFKHPKHLEDAILAMSYLRDNYGVGAETKYIGVGHSCGATMLVQLAIRALPKSVAGESGFGSACRPCGLSLLAGIYDLPLLVKNHPTIDYYQRFVTNAFGDDEKVWVDFSPVNGDPRKVWEGIKAITIAYSIEDELVEIEQATVMMHSLSEVKESNQLMLTGRHDELWRLGQPLATAIRDAIALQRGEDWRN